MMSDDDDDDDVWTEQVRWVSDRFLGRPTAYIMKDEKEVDKTEFPKIKNLLSFFAMIKRKKKKGNVDK